jgi:hypothetical protein
MAATEYQRLIGLQFLQQCRWAMLEHATKATEPTGDVEFDEFHGIVESDVIVNLMLPPGISKELYILVLKEALHAMFEGTELDDAAMRDAIERIK